MERCMASEHRFVLAASTYSLHADEARRHHLMPAAVAHAAARRDLMARGKPVLGSSRAS